MRIEKIKRKTVVEQVMEKMKEMIASGQYKPRDKLPTEGQLAEMFGIGRSSIREAIKLFNYLGILKSTPRLGTIVCDRSNISTEALTWAMLLGNKDMFEIIDLRALIEEKGLVSLKETQQNKPEMFKQDYNALENEVSNLKKAVINGSIETIIEADYEFHGIIIRASGISLFNDIYRTLVSYMREEIIKSLRENLEDIVKEHTQYLNSIKTGELTLMKSSLDAHIKQIKFDIERRSSM
jgi:GntR family transcriptional regulator, transcriptional repressor for pyruvate dehydrogenase complex